MQENLIWTINIVVCETLILKLLGFAVVGSVTNVKSVKLLCFYKHRFRQRDAVMSARKLRNQGPCRLPLRFLSVGCHEVPTSCPDCWVSLCYLLAAHSFIGVKTCGLMDWPFSIIERCPMKQKVAGRQGPLEASILLELMWFPVVDAWAFHFSGTLLRVGHSVYFIHWIRPTKLSR